MVTAQKSEDAYLYKKDRIVLTSEQFFVPGIRMFGLHKINSVTPSLDWHYHENAFEFSVPSKGDFSFATLEQTHSFSRGDVHISFPSEIHGTNHAPVGFGSLYWFQLDVSHTENFLFLAPDAAQSLIRSLMSLPSHVIKTDIRQMYPLLEKAFNYGQEQQTALLAASYLQLFLNLLLFFANESAALISSDIQAAQEYIHIHVEEEISLDHLAKIASLSISQFKEKFKKQIGATPRHYINQKKIEHAKTLLNQGLSVTETAMQLHFSTSGYFSTVFKKYTLDTPGEYIRKQTSTPNEL